MIALLAMTMAAGAPSAAAQTAVPSSARTDDRLSPDQRRALASAVANAEQMEKEGRLVDALWWRQVAQAITPNAQADAELKRTTDLIGAQVENLLRDAEHLQRRVGGQAAAAKVYEQVLQLDPRSQAARSALREMDDKAILTAIAKGGGRGPAAPAAGVGR